MTLPELLSDPVRARIYIEVLMRKEATAEELKDVVNVSRSTISHHLTRFVNERVLAVRVGSEKYTRNVKYYRINPDYSEDLLIDSAQDPEGQKRKAFIESAAAHLQVVSNLMLEYSRGPKESAAGVVFTFNILSEEDAKTWMEEYSRFQKRIQSICEKGIAECANTSFSYLAFGGIIPSR
ncbi:MAG: ArsR/SmtB family transcription factor [Candidatus Thorarchaeota archaeon]